MADLKQQVNRHDVLLLGGAANSVSVARSLGKNNIKVSVAAPQKSLAAKSKFVTDHFVQPEGMDATEFYYDLLLQQKIIKPETVIFACDDHAISVVARNKTALLKKYILDIQKPDHQLDLLDKQKTLDLASRVNCPVPKYWRIKNIEDVINAITEITFPVLIKPIHSHIFQKHFHKKLFLAENKLDLKKLTQTVFDVGIDFMLCEFIPGPDSLLSSYYTFIDNEGEKHFDYTKQIERRSPVNFGCGTYHRSKWLPETAAMGLRFFEGINFTGLGNIEFKYDTRDNQLKVIESNARFTAAQALVTQSGIDMPYLIYQYLVNNKKPDITTFTDNVTLLCPFEDFDAFRELHSLGNLTFFSWLKSILRPHVFSYYTVFDSKPFFFALHYEVTKRLKWFFKKRYNRE